MVPRTKMHPKMHRCHKDDLPVWQTMKKAMANFDIKINPLNYGTSLLLIAKSGTQ